MAGSRIRASESDRDTAKESDLLQREKEINAQLDDLAGRVGAFSSLALHQMERIRVKYHPAGFLCSVPLVRNIMSGSCLPIRTASNVQAMGESVQYVERQQVADAVLFLCSAQASAITGTVMPLG